jgi:hypothetical protein
MKILPLQGSTAKTLLFQKISTACGGLPNGGARRKRKTHFFAKIFDRLRRSN